MSSSFQRYGETWRAGMDALTIELWAIAAGGKWANRQGQECGLGTFEHMMNARALLWPNRYRHRWTDTMYRNFIENDVTILMGCASAQKTSHAVEYALLNYWARPEKTLVVLSTVNMDKLDIGVYAELSMLWKAGRARFPWLSGHSLSHKRAITTDSLEENDIRDFRKGCICRPCFPTGTLVDTPAGQVPIERIQPGDTVINAVGVGVVRRTSRTKSAILLRVRIADGRSIDCTPEHPFLTHRGWVKAGNLSRHDVVFSPDEARRIALQDLPELRPGVYAQGAAYSFLRSVLRGEMEHEAARSGRESVCQSGLESGWGENQAGDFGKPRGEAKAREFFSQQGWSGGVRFSETVMGDSAVQGALRVPQEGYGKCADSSRSGVAADVSKWVILPHDLHQSETEKRWLALVQDRCGVSSNTPCCGGGRRLPLSPPANAPRLGAGYGVGGAWVDGVEVLQRAGDERFQAGEGGYTVHNLEVAGHPSYSIQNTVVHNCYVGGKWVGLGVLAGLKQEFLIYICDELQFMQPTFASSWPHLFSNGHVKIIGSGNPKHDPEDQLSIAAEPAEGWAGHPEPDKTEEWPTKFMGAKCVNLVGTDSPNFDGPADAPAKYPNLIDRKFERRIANDFGSDSFEYYRLVKGVMKLGFALSRVITRKLCKDHLASDKALWSGSRLQRIYWLDPSYGGDDACAGGCLEWGESLDGLTQIRLVGYRLYQFNLREGAPEVEDQIANTLEQELGYYGVVSTDVFYDSTGKGTLGSAFARKFGTAAPVAVDSGGRPSARPVRAGLEVEEKDGARRPKRCDEHYDRFISELWFSVRYAIEAGQMRELPEDFITEGCARIYEVVGGNKISVECKHDPKKKEDLKRRLGHSPNLFDGLAIGIEGARQRGFVIDRLGADGVANSGEDEDFFAKEARKYRDVIKSKLLNHTAR